MLRANLATRPFYNERAVHVLVAVAAAIVLAITAVNVTRIVTLSRRSTELSSRTNRDRTEASRLSTEAMRIRRAINKDELAAVVNAAQEANSLIDQRTFSWTEFFNQIESTIPPDVMLTAVRPSFKEGLTHVSMLVLARRFGDIDEFNDKLEATGLFEDVNPATNEQTDDGLWRATIESTYTGNVAASEGKETESATSPPSTTPGVNASGATAPGTSAPGRRGQPATPAPTAQPPRDRGRQ